MHHVDGGSSGSGSGGGRFQTDLWQDDGGEHAAHVQTFPSVSLLTSDCSGGTAN